MKKIILTALVIVSAQFATAQEATVAEVKEVLILSGVNSQYDAVLEQVYAMVPPAKLPELKKEMQVILDRQTEKTAGIWTKYYTKTEIAELRKFYNSPVGKKLIENTSKILVESMADQQVIGMEIQGLVMKYMQ